MGASAHSPAMLAGSRQWAQTARLLSTRGVLVTHFLSAPLRGIMCLDVTLLSLHNADYVLWGPVTSSPMALIDSKARRTPQIRLSQKWERNPESAGQVECKRVFVFHEGDQI